MSPLLYTWFLNLYPQELRREYGEEMTLVFADELRSRGSLRAWWNVFRELSRVVLPRAWSEPALRVPITGAVFALCSMIAIIVVEQVRHWSPRFFTAAAAIPSFGPIVLALFVTWACRSRAVISLGIANSERRTPHPPAGARPC